MYDHGPQYQEKAIHLFEQIFNRNQDHPQALLGYCIAAADRGQGQESLPHIFKAIVSSQQKNCDKETKRRIGLHFASIVDRRNGVNDILNFLKESALSVAAVSFLARIANDNGAIDTSKGLFEQCCKIEPTNRSMALNLIHTCEVLADYKSAFQHCKKFLRDNISASAGGLNVSKI